MHSSFDLQYCSSCGGGEGSLHLLFTTEYAFVSNSFRWPDRVLVWQQSLPEYSRSTTVTPIRTPRSFSVSEGLEYSGTDAVYTVRSRTYTAPVGYFYPAAAGSAFSAPGNLQQTLDTNLKKYQLLTENDKCKHSRIIYR